MNFRNSNVWNVALVATALIVGAILIATFFVEPLDHKNQSRLMPQAEAN